MAVVRKRESWRWTRWSGGALIAVVVLLVFQSARHGALLAWDDDINIVNNPHLRELSWENVRWMFTDASYMRRYVPLAWLNWSFDRAIAGLTPESCHIGNILFHAANSLLIFLLVHRVIRLWMRGRGVSDRALWLASAAGALLWAVHPLRVEVVAWASGRIYCQAGFFLLLSTLAYLRAAAADTSDRGRRWSLLAAFVAFAASLLTYPLAVTFVAVLVVMDFYLLRRLRTEVGLWRDPENRRVWLEKLPFLIVVVAVLAVTLVARFQATIAWPAAPALAEFGPAARAMQAFYVWAYYVWKPFVPAGLAPVYTTLVGFDPFAAKFVLSAVGVLAVSVLLFCQRKRWPALFGLWLCHLAVLAPMLGLTERPHYANDRYSYLQGVLWSLAIAGLLVRVRAMRSVAVASVIGVVVVLSALSVAQIGIWRNSETLFRFLHQHVGDTPYRGDIALRLGDVLRAEGRMAEAAEYYRESLAKRGTGMRAGYVHWGLGKIAEHNRALERAAEHYRKAIELAPKLADPYFDYGALLLQSGPATDAIALFKSGLGLEPGQARWHLALADALRQAGRTDEADAAFREAARLDPNLARDRKTIAR